MYLKRWKWKRRESQAEAEGSWARGRRFGRTAPCCHACINLHCIHRFSSIKSEINEGLAWCKR